jgi:DNA-binding GntR family transcriptional regulator
MKPGYHEIYSRYRDNITRGVLKPGDKVPAIRVLAEELKVARKTVETAYAILTGEGYLVSQGARGTRVNPDCCCRTSMPLRNSPPVRFRHRSSASASGRVSAPRHPRPRQLSV